MKGIHYFKSTLISRAVNIHMLTNDNGLDRGPIGGECAY